MQMDQLIADFPTQLRRALEISEAHPVQPKTHSHPRNLAVFGMGGSAFGGELFKNLTESRHKIPVLIHRSYQIPAYIGEDSLCVICSYSGNTEETLLAAQSSAEKGAEIVVISSGGLLKTWSEENHHTFIQIPGGHPPRTAFGYTFVQLLHVAYSFGLIDEFYNRLNRAIEILEHHSPAIKQQAEKMALECFRKIPVIYSDDSLQAVSLRWRQQIAENAKILCWHHTLPEMNHNELVGWVKDHAFHEQAVVFMLRSTVGMHPRTTHHYHFLKDFIESKNTKIHEIVAETNDILSDMLYLIHWGDWLSYYWALRNEVDPIEVNVINRLKNYLSEQP